MNFLSSLFLGTDGRYNINGIEVHFSQENPGMESFGRSWFGWSVKCLLTNSGFRLLSFGYLHIFVHEMGHAFSSQLLQTNPNPTVRVYTKQCQGNASVGPGLVPLLAGPLAGVTLETAKLVGAAALAIFFPTPIGLFVGGLIGGGAVVWLFGELMYALIAERGDWVDIARHGIFPLLLSITILLGTIALGAVTIGMLL